MCKTDRLVVTHPSVNGNNQVPTCKVTVKFRDNLREAFEMVPGINSVLNKQWLSSVFSLHCISLRRA